jgi:hypothetical protein
MIVLTLSEINQYRSELANDPEALRALDMIEDCEGDVEDAAIALAIQAGQEPDRSEYWLDGLAKRWRVFLCQVGFRNALTEGEIATAVQLFAAETTIPSSLATPIIIYILKIGIEDFCKPLGEML